LTDSPFQGTPLPVADIVGALRRQSGFCQEFGSPLTALILENLACDVDSDGITARIIAGWSLPPTASALSLRLAGAFNHLVITGQAPELARFYPPNPWPEDTATFNRILLATAARQAPVIRDFLHHVVQTNETRRSIALMAGFLEVVRRTGLPLHLLEIGASGGLNQMWHQFFYELGTDYTWGNSESSVRLSCDWTGDPPPLYIRPQVRYSRGCDIAPIDIHNDEEVRRIRSYIWPDQLDRLERFGAALDLARRTDVRVDKADAADWLENELERRPGDAVCIVFHSIMWQYLPAATQRRITARLEHEGATSPVGLASEKWRAPVV